MTYQISSISQLSATTLQSNEAFLVAFLTSQFPDVDFTPGSVMREVLIRPAAMIYSLDQQNVSLLEQSSSMLAMSQNPNLADTTTVANILSNFGITESAGSYATGTVAFVFNSQSVVSIPSTTALAGSGSNFVPSSGVVGVAAGTTNLLPGQQAFTPVGNGSYALYVPVTAQVVGPGSLITQNTVFSVSPQPPGLQSAYATSDFTGGLAADTPTSLLGKLAAGVTAKTVGSRSGTTLMLKNQFPQIQDMSIIGFGDPEMLRDTHNIFSVHGGGKVDIYARTAAAPQNISQNLTAYLADPATGTWTLNIPRGTFPGFYYITSILPANNSSVTGTFQISSDVRGSDTSAITSPTPVDVTPVMQGMESAFTRYQTATITFTDTVTPSTTLAVGASNSYNVTALMLPNLDTVNDYVLSRSVRTPGADLLVKAPIPCIVSVALTVTQGPSDTAPNIAAITEAVSNAINNLDFATGQLAASVVVEAAQGALTGRSKVASPVMLTGMIAFPNQTYAWINSTDTLVPPKDVSLMASSRTISFFCMSDSVSVNVVPSVALPV